ncbi:MAG TPA: hypothetical protein VG842_03740 [Sediminibacterium sp.]|nr:hypothetical protein [Sediminibacterium sp.]
MKTKYWRLACLLCFFMVFQSSHAQKSGYKLINTFHISSPGGWDYPSADPQSNYLYLSHGNQVNILNKMTGDSVGVIPNTTGVHGIAFVHDQQKGYVSAGRLNVVVVFSLSTGETLKQIPVGKNPDWIFYDDYSKRIITSNHTGGDISLIDPVTDQVTATIEVGGKLETIVSDMKGRLYINVEDKNAIAEIDLKQQKVTNTWPLPAEGPTGLAMDTKTRRLFSSCDGKLVVLNADNGKVVDTIAIGDGADGAAFDPGTHLIFTSNGSGTLSVIRERDADHFQLVEDITTKRGARTISVDPSTHRVYLPTADYEAPAPGATNGRPRMVPGSFQVLVYGK